MDAGTIQRDRETLRQWLAGFEYAMLTTRTRDGALDSRPVEVMQVDADCAIWFFTNQTSDKVAQIQDEAHVNLALASDARKIFVSVSGLAALVADRHKLDELWRPQQTIFFPHGRDDPSLVLLRVRPTSARYWDGNESAPGLVLKFGKALLRGQASDLGSSARLDFDADG